MALARDTVDDAKQVALELLVVGRIKCVWEIYADAFIKILYPSLPECHRELEVRDGVARHHQLKAVEARQEVVIHVRTPPSLLGLLSFVDEANGLIEEGARPHGHVEYLDAVEGTSFLYHVSFVVLVADYLVYCRSVGEAVVDAKLTLEEVIQSADDKPHNGERGVEDAHLHFLLWIILAQEVFVEVNDGVGRFFGATIEGHLFEVFFHQGADVGVWKYDTELVDDYLKTTRKRRSWDVVEETLEERVGGGNEWARFLATKVVEGGVVVARGEESVDEGLRVHIGEVRGGEFGNEMVFNEALHFLEVGLSVAVACKEGDDVVADTLGLPTHDFGEVAGASDGLFLLADKIGDGTSEVVAPVRMDGKGTSGFVNVSEFDSFVVSLTIAEKAKFDIVADNEIGVAEIAVGLGAFFDFVEVFTDFLDFDVEERDLIAKDDVVGFVTVDSLGVLLDEVPLVGGENSRKVVLKGGTVGVFGAIGVSVILGNFGEVGRCVVHIE